MAYTISNTSGSNTYSVIDGYLNSTDLDLTLIGRGYIGYGNTLNTNFVKLLENFSDTEAPTKPITGQLWYDKLASVLKVYNGSSFVSIVYSSESDATIGSIRLYSGNVYGQTTNANVNIIPNGTGYTVVNKLGIVATNTGKLLYTAANGTVQSTTASYTFAGDTIGVSSVNATLISGTITTPTQGSITSLGTLTSLSVSGIFTVNSGGNVTAIANGGSTGVGNIGTSSNGFNTVFAKATAAQYADLAELYEADAAYEPGTVVDFGGEFDITISAKDSTRVAGVISTNPAYLMNSSAIGDFMLPVALTGRVPCRVIGEVQKGDILVSDGNGYAIVNNHPNAGTIIGKALRNHSGGIGIIEVVVGRY